MRRFFSSLILEVQSFSKKEKWFVLFSCICCFLIAGEYGITRPASHSLFVSTFGSGFIPFLWLATVPINFLAISLYNKYIPRLGPLKMWSLVSLSVVIVNGLAYLLLNLYPKYIFFQCIWKDIYILLVFKQLWSMIHCTIPGSKAKYIYGIIYAMGTVGSSLCSCFASGVVLAIGTISLFAFSIPAYFTLFFSFRSAFNRSAMLDKSWDKEILENPSTLESFSLVGRNRFLLAILFLVIAMQVSSGFMEFQFNAYLEKNIFDVDLRTTYCAQLFGIMNLLSMLLQSFGSYLIIQAIGLRRTHFLIPILLLGSALCSWIIPSFALISVSYVLLKALDFSLFSVSREMLYIPFGLDEKYRAKAIIDVFAYRSSKALVSISIMFLQAFAGAYLLEMASYVSIAIFMGWISVVFFMLRNDPKLKSIQM